MGKYDLQGNILWVCDFLAPRHFGPETFWRSCFAAECLGSKTTALKTHRPHKSCQNLNLSDLGDDETKDLD